MLSTRKEVKDVPPKHIDEKMEIQKLLPDSKFPHREEGRDSDIGMKVTLVSRSDNRTDDVTGDYNNFRTGLAISPPEGYYAEIAASDDLHRHGYTLMNGSQIINPGSTGEVIVSLYKYKEAEDIELPFDAVQLILKPAVYAHIKSVKNLTAGAGGMEFGGGNFGPFGGMMPQPGMYIQNPQSSAYGGDMAAYQNQISGYPRGVPRPQAAPRQSNHMF